MKNMTPLEVIRLLRKRYLLHKTSLVYRDEWQFLVAIILSAQCTDARVNLVTPGLFKALPRLNDFAAAPQKKLEQLIFSTGFYKNKARSIKGAAQTILEKYHGTIPNSMDELVTIPGVGRKTANVFLHVVHGKAEGVVVYTHIFRVSRRTGVSNGTSADQVERDVMRQLPKQHWIIYGDLVIQHGRKTCHARKPACRQCILNTRCPRAYKI